MPYIICICDRQKEFDEPKFMVNIETKHKLPLTNKILSIKGVLKVYKPNHFDFLYLGDACRGCSYSVLEDDEKSITQKAISYCVYKKKDDEYIYVGDVLDESFKNDKKCLYI